MESVIGMLGLTSEELLAMAAGAVICVGLVRAFKKLWNRDTNTTRIVAFAVGSFATYTMIPPMGLTFDWKSLWLSVGVGLAVPAVVGGLKAVGKKRKWAWVEAI